MACGIGRNLEKATLETIEAGEMTKDLAMLSTLEHKKMVNTHEFISCIHKRLVKLYE
ncbi:MAG: hypothetical protein V8Q43_03600 [Christensenellaceae bacterium]